MARPVSELTQAIRKLIETKGDIPYSEAQNELEQMGFEVVRKPDMSNDLKAWREKGKFLGLPPKGDYINCHMEGNEYKYDADAFEQLKSECGFSAARANKVLQEIMVRSAAVTESNNFNVVKYNWLKKKSQHEPTTSRQPGRKRGRPAGKRAPKEAQPIATVSKELTPQEALDHVKSNGGVSAVKSRMEKIDGEIADLERQIAELRAEQEQHSNAVNTLANFEKDVREAA